MRSVRQAAHLIRLGLGTSARHSSSPSVFDKMVQLNVIDQAGRRHVLRGMEGQSLVELLQNSEDTLGEGALAVTGLSPEGRGALEAHVTVPNEFLHLIPEPSDDDVKALQEIAPVHSRNSRLASKIVLSKQMENLSIALGSMLPWRTL